MLRLENRWIWDFWLARTGSSYLRHLWLIGAAGSGKSTGVERAG